MLYERIPEQSGTISEAGGAWSSKYTYTDFDAVATRKDARGVVTTYGYDSLNRLTSISYDLSGASGVGATNNVTYAYDTVDGSATEGLLLSITMSGPLATYTETFSYDSASRVSSRTWTRDGRSYTISYQYNTASQLTRLTYPSNRAVNINHDNQGRLASVVNNGDSTNYLSNVSYNHAGQTTGWTLGSNIVEGFGYSAQRMQLTSQTATQNSQTRLSLTYGYDALAGQMGGGSTAGNAGQVMSVSGTIGGTSESASYTYDNVGRLVTSNQTTNGASAQRRFAYDRFGNRTGVWDAVTGGSQIQSVSLGQEGGVTNNRVASVTGGGTLNYTYDAAGNVTNDGAHTYQYDGENRVKAVDDGTGSAVYYAYDHQNRRIKRVAGAASTHYVYEGSQVIAEHNASTGAVVTEYIYAGSRMIAREQGGRVFFLQDRLSVRAVITDGQGGIQGRQGHLPFGEEVGVSGSQEKHRFTSYERDAESGTDYAINRQYAPQVGRFMRPDPYGGSYDISNPQSANRFT